MKRLIIVSLFFVLFPIALQAQSNYKAGYVVTTAGDTLKGRIDYQEWNQTPGSVSFKASVDGENKQEFDANTARYFEITGLEAYKRYEGPITMNEVDIRRLSTNRDMRLTTTTVFLKQLHAGENVSLFSYTDRVKTRYFILEKNDSVPQELYIIKYYVPGSGNKMLTMKSYVGQLLSVASKYTEVTPELKRKVESAAYAAEPLLSIVSKFNGQSDARITSEMAMNNKHRFYAGVAVNRTIVQFHGENGFSNANHNPVSYMPSLVFGLDGFINRNTQRVLLRAEGRLTGSNHHIAHKFESSSGSHEISYDITQQTASLIPQVIYNLYNKEHFKFYLGGGFSVNYTNYSTNKSGYVYVSSGTGTRYGPEERQSYKLEPVWTSFMVRSGLVLNKKYEISAIYQAPASLTKYFDFAVEHQSMSLGINYLFSK